MDEKVSKTLNFLSSYHKMIRQLKIFKESKKYYETVTVDEEIEARSVSHPAESDNIGAGRNISVSEKTANIALNLPNIATDITKNLKELNLKISTLEWKINLIIVYGENLIGIDKDIYSLKFIENEEISNEEIAKKIRTKKSITGKTVANRLNKIINEFANTYNKLDI